MEVSQKTWDSLWFLSPGNCLLEGHSACIQMPLGTYKGSPVLQDFCWLCLETPFVPDVCCPVTLREGRSISWLNTPHLVSTLLLRISCSCFLRPLYRITSSQRLKTTQICSPISVGLAIPHKFCWPKLRCWQVFPSGGSRGNPCPCLSELLKAAHIPWFVAPSLHRQSQQCCICLERTCEAEFHAFRNAGGEPALCQVTSLRGAPHPRGGPLWKGGGMCV